MKIVKTASGKKLKMSKKEWEKIGKKAGWYKEADVREHSYYPRYIKEDLNRMMLVNTETGVEWPARYDVCSVCNGQGKHVNPSIDSHGISTEEFAEDPDFKEDYFGGVYDVMCESCKGKRVILVPSTEEGQAAIDEILQEEARYRAEVAAEQRMGA
jgi:hypothetical protein